MLIPGQGMKMPDRATDEARVSDGWNVYGGLISVEDSGVSNQSSY